LVALALTPPPTAAPKKAINEPNVRQWKRPRRLFAVLFVVLCVVALLVVVL